MGPGLSVIGAVVLAWPIAPPAPAPGQAPASASAPPEDARAEAAFAEAKKLQDEGHLLAACERFHESQHLSPGIGITLHLADCYERTGRTASAWREFTSAERAASAKADARADLAHLRALALEGRLTRLTVEVPASAVADHWEVRVDGAVLDARDWNAALPIDPGHHEVARIAPGRAVRTLPVEVDQAGPAVIVRLDEAPPPPPPAPFAPPASSPPTREAADPSRGRRYVEYGLLAGGAVSLGVGIGLLAAKNGSLSSGDASSPPQIDDGLSTASKVAFGLGGAALASVVVLYLTTPTNPQTGLLVSPASVAGGGGAVLRGAF
jgi:hypothetical protein